MLLRLYALPTLVPSWPTTYSNNVSYPFEVDDTLTYRNGVKIRSGALRMLVFLRSDRVNVFAVPARREK